MTRKDCDIIEVDEWKCPEGTGVPILVMPNIPRALHGPGLQPRTIYGKTTWDFMRRKAYLNAGYKCEICGCDPPRRGDLHSHELFSYDYLKQEGTFERCVAICRTCHDFIHSGRLMSMYRRGNPLYPKKYVLRVAEHGFKLVNEYNKTHPENQKRIYASWVDGLRGDLKEELYALFKKYDVKFFIENVPKSKRWRGWHVIVGTRRIESPYKSQSDWERAMLEMSMRDSFRQAENTPFKGEGFSEIDKILQEAEKEPD